MIRVIGANPAMDRISTWPPLQLGRVNRAAAVSVVPGGKGFNVARAAIRLGEPATTHGFLGGHVGSALREMIMADGVIDRHTAIAAGTRVCFIVVEPGSERTTVLNEPGPPVTDAEISRFLDDLRGDCGADDLVILAGSLPDSVPPSVAGEILDIGRAAGARSLVDIHSEALRIAFAHRPWMLKCNRRELLELLGDPDPEARVELPDLAAEMQRIRERGIEIVVVTMGSEGALLADGEGVVHAQVPRIEEVNPTGSGDLLLAGLAVGIERGQAARDAIVLGAACGTAGATHLPPELPSDFDPAAWMPRISLEVISPAP
ncbi:MAG: hexose kinase [Chloroflexota bacterium]|nr:hexose kinase [Chloroflexota bacterium]